MHAFARSRADRRRSPNRVARQGHARAAPSRVGCTRGRCRSSRFLRFFYGWVEPACTKYSPSGWIYEPFDSTCNTNVNELKLWMLLVEDTPYNWTNFIYICVTVKPTKQHVNSLVSQLNTLKKNGSDLFQPTLTLKLNTLCLYIARANATMTLGSYTSKQAKDYVFHTRE